MRRRTSAPKPFGAGLLVHADDVAARLAQAVAHAVIAREVRRGLRRRHDVIGRQRVFGVRQRHLDDVRAGVLEPGDALLPQRVDLGGHAVEPVFLRDADGHALDRLAERRLVVRHRAIDRGRILRIVPGHRAQQDRGVAHRARDRAGLVERRGERDDAPARAAPVGRLDPDRAGERGRLADRAAGVGRGRAQAESAPRPPPPSRRTSRPAPAAVFDPLRRHGLITGPKHEVSFDEPIANSSLLSLPSITAPSRQSCAVTVDS